MKRLTRLRIAALTALIICTAGAASSAKAPEKAALKELEAGQKAASKDKVAEARVRFEKAIALKPDLAEAWFELGRLQVKEGDAQAARVSYDRAIQSDPKYYEAYVNLAVLARQEKNWDRVLDLTQRLLKINAVDFPLAYLERAIAQYNLGDFARAETTARAGVQVAPPGQPTVNFSSMVPVSRPASAMMGLKVDPGASCDWMARLSSGLSGLSRISFQ